MIQLPWEKRITRNGLIACVVALALSASTALATPKVARDGGGPLAQHDLAGITGKEGTLVMVRLNPGEAAPAHRHNANVFVYVLEGSIVMQVKGGPLVTLGVGQTFYEGPDDVHVIGRNASRTKPARFLAFLVKDKGAPVVFPAR